MAYEKWEYATLHFALEIKGDFWHLKVTFFDTSSPSEGRPVWTGEMGGADYPGTVPLLNQCGAAGWELVGSPGVQNAFVNVESSGGRKLEKGQWVERDFWLKRRIRD
jgi:hypothetical protein